MNERSVPHHDRGVVLIIVLVVVVVLSLAAYTFSSLMQTHRHAVKLSGQQLQTRMLVDSGVEMVKQYLSTDAATREEMGGHFDNPAMFQGVTVIPGTELDSRGSFCVLAPYPEDGAGQTSGGIRYGLDDESTKLNLNVLLLADQLGAGSARTLLMGLPGMTEDVADAILDWLDEDDEPREYGAEADYYARLEPPYGPQNGSLTTVEELLLVRGVTPDLLFGLDQNRNGLVDAHESGSLGSTPGAGAPTSSASMAGGGDMFPQRGWSPYLTLYSAEQNMTAEGLPRINLNNQDLQALSDELTEVFDDEWVNFILAYRLYGPADDNQGGGGQSTTSAADLDLDLSQSPKAQLSQVLDLIGKQVQIGQGEQEGGGPESEGASAPSNGGRGSGCQSGGAQNQQAVVASPFAEDPLAMAIYLPELMDKCTVSESPMIPGRININLASESILFGIPGMTEEIVTSLLESRQFVEDVGLDLNREHETWLLSESLVTLDEMRTLLPFVTSGGDVFRAQIVGYYQGGGPSSRVEVVFDATDVEPRILFWRDISHLGRGYALQTLGIDTMMGPSTAQGLPSP